jgi:predicted small lipoprotein YifL
MKILDRRRFALMLVAAGLVSGVAACGRRGPLEPPPDSAQGREWAKRSGRNNPNDPKQKQAPKQTEPQASVSEGLQRDEDQRGTVDVEADIERKRGEGVARAPSDPTRDEPSVTPSPLPTGGRRRPPGIVPPKRSFLLDGLLE